MPNPPARSPPHNDLDAVFAARGWLTEHSAGFRSQMIELGVVTEVPANRTIFREGDTSNGLYGVVTGSIGIEGGHRLQTPLLGHIMRAGEWFGIKAVLHGGRRELTYRALEPTRLLFVANFRILPLMQKNPDTAVRIGQLAELGNRLGSWVTRDLLTPDASRRLAAVLLRVLGMGEVTPGDPRGFCLTHRQLGEMANLSRHHVGRKLAEFEQSGWISCSYNRINLLKADALSSFAYGDEEI